MPENRELPDWLTEFMDHAKWGEAPEHFYFWVGIATVAAALRRRVWLDMGTFTWYPNLYTLLVAPPGVANKSTTSDLGMNLLKDIPGIQRGPTTLTWQSLYDAFLEVGVEFEVSKDEVRTEQALYINSREFGTTLKMDDTEMIDHLTDIWDCCELKKRTRSDGEILIPHPVMNILACTTPAWISKNIPEYLICGGLTSRMLFVYGEKKARYVAYPQNHIPHDYKERRARLTRDLERISQLVGNFTLSLDAMQWGEEWYEHFHKVESAQLDPILIGGYIARKQTLVHKVAMVLTVSQGEALVITRATLERAVRLITDLEGNMPQVYNRIGMSQDSNAGLQVIAYLDRNGGSCDFNSLYRYMHRLYPNPEDFENVLRGMIEARYITIDKAARKVIKL